MAQAENLWDTAKGTQRKQQLPQPPQTSEDQLLQSLYHDPLSRDLATNCPHQEACPDGCKRQDVQAAAGSRMRIGGPSKPGRSHVPYVTDFKMLLLFLNEGFLSHSLPYRITLSCQPRLHRGPAVTEAMLGRGGRKEGEELHQYLLFQRVSRSHVTCAPFWQTLQAGKARDLVTCGEGRSKGSYRRLSKTVLWGRLLGD